MISIKEQREAIRAMTDAEFATAMKAKAWIPPEKITSPAGRDAMRSREGEELRAKLHGTEN